MWYIREYECEGLLLHVIKGREGAQVCVRKKGEGSVGFISMKNWDVESLAWKILGFHEKRDGSMNKDP